MTIRGIAILAVIAALSSPSTAIAATQRLTCTAPRASAVTINLSSQRRFGRPLSCIDADFVADMTPCAPDGSFGLSAPTGAADLVRIVDRWQDYADHTGGVTSHFTTPRQIYFAGGWNSSESGFQEQWEFTVNRATKKALLKVEGRPAKAYACRAA